MINYGKKQWHALRAFVAKQQLPNHAVIRGKLRRSLLVLKKGLEQERRGTQQMLLAYRRYTQGEASEAEIQEANRQLKDLFRSLGLSVVVILPFSPITLPAIVKLGEKLGIDVLPRSFRETSDDSQPDPLSDVEAKPVLKE